MPRPARTICQPSTWSSQRSAKATRGSGNATARCPRGRLSLHHRRLVLPVPRTVDGLLPARPAVCRDMSQLPSARRWRRGFLPQPAGPSHLCPRARQLARLPLGMPPAAIKPRAWMHRSTRYLRPTRTTVSRGSRTGRGSRRVRAGQRSARSSWRRDPTWRAAGGGSSSPDRNVFGQAKRFDRQPFHGRFAPQAPASTTAAVSGDRRG